MRNFKRLVSLVLAVAICATLGMTAFAASDSESGTTSGTSGTINTRASLTVSVHTGTATTSAGTTDGVTLTTTLTYYYRDPNTGHVLAKPTAVGTSSASSGNSTRSGVNAKSEHSVKGGTRWGNWKANLEAYAT